MPLDYARVAALWAEGLPSEEIDRLMKHAQAVCHARRALGVERVPLRLPVPDIDLERVAFLWKAKASAKEIDALMGSKHCVTRARRSLGASRVPVRRIFNSPNYSMKTKDAIALARSVKAGRLHQKSADLRSALVALLDHGEHLIRRLKCTLGQHRGHQVRGVRCCNYCSWSESDTP